MFLLTVKHGLLIFRQGSYHGTALIERFYGVNSLSVFVGSNISSASA